MSRSTLFLVAVAATSVIASPQWEAVPKASTTITSKACAPTTSVYECDNEYGTGSYTTTLTLYPKGCPKYTPIDDYPIRTGTWSVWDPKVTTTTKNTKTWETYDPSPTSTWASWTDKDGKGKPKTVVTVTLTETYKVPCETGWATSTSTMYTTWCGCKETPKPEHPEYTTYTTTCPESWGVGKTVTVTVPTAEPQTWYTASIKTPVADTQTQTWNTASVPVDNKSTNTWATVPVSQASVTSCQYSYTTITASKCSSSWAEWDTSKTGSASCVTSTTVSTITPATCTGTWASWSPYSTGVAASTSGWSPVAAYTGAASTTANSKVLIAMGGAIAGLAYFL